MKCVGDLLSGLVSFLEQAPWRKRAAGKVPPACTASAACSSVLPFPFEGHLLFLLLGGQREQSFPEVFGFSVVSVP